MPLHIGPYLADTMHLRTVEHGAYMLLLIHYWTKGPLANDDRKLAGIARMAAKEWVEHGPTVREFFYVGDDGLLHQKRADAELAKAALISSKRSDAARASHEQRGKQPPSKPDANADAIAPANAHANAEQVHTHARVAIPKPLPEPSKEEEPFALLTPSPQGGEAKEPAGFSEFWAAYPRKVGKDAARVAYAKAIKRAAPVAILRAVLAQRWHEDTSLRPHPSTWLSQGRWQDDPDDGAPAPITPILRGPLPSKDAHLAAYAAEMMGGLRNGGHFSGTTLDLSPEDVT